MLPRSAHSRCNCQTAKRDCPYSWRRRVRRNLSRLSPGNSFSLGASPRGWSAERRHHQSTALRRRASCDRRARHSALHRGDFCSPGPRFLVSVPVSSLGPQRQFASSACRALVRPKPSRTVPVQQAPCGAVLVPPDRVPKPPGSGVTSPARGRRTSRSRYPRTGPKTGACSPAPAPLLLHLRNVSRRRPQ